MDEQDLLSRITVNPQIFGGKPIVRGRRLAVEHVLGMLAAGDSPEVILEGYPWMEPKDIRACLVYARRHVGHERIELLQMESVARRSFSTRAFGEERRTNCAQRGTMSSGLVTGRWILAMIKSSGRLTANGEPS
jgi:uncharacterized protein (DUF433 family)